MKSRTAGILSLGLAIALLSFACGGGEKGPARESTAQPEGRVAEPKAELSPAEVGRQVGEIYIKAMADLVELLKDKPETSVVMEKVDALKQACVAKLVDLGRKREALDAAGRAAVDGQISLKVNSLYNDPIFSAFNEIQQHYFQDRDFHKVVVSFNIITQYANFDLLKKQEPEEALRLGIQ